MISFVKMEWQWLGHNVAKENLWTSVTLACIAIFVEFFYLYRHVFESQTKEKYAMVKLLHFTLIHRLLQTYLTEKIMQNYCWTRYIVHFPIKKGTIIPLLFILENTMDKERHLF